MGNRDTTPSNKTRQAKQPADVIKAEMKGWNIVQTVQPGEQDSNQLQAMKSSRKPDAVSPELAALRKKFRRPDVNPEKVADAASTKEYSAKTTTKSTTKILRVAPAKAGSVDDRAQARAKSVVIKGDEIIGEQG